MENLDFFFGDTKLSKSINAAKFFRFAPVRTIRISNQETIYMIVERFDTEF